MSNVLNKENLSKIKINKDNIHKVKKRWSEGKLESVHYVTVTDKILASTLLKIIPQSITPNQITIIRFILTPIVGWFLYQEMYIAGFWLFLFNMLTDAIDGAMARTRNQITDLGKIIDPIADKLAVSSAAILLVFKFLNPMIGWLIIIVDILIILVGSYEKYILKRVIQAEIFGKMKLITQVIGIAILLIYIITKNTIFLVGAQHILILAIVLALISLVRPHSI